MDSFAIREAERILKDEMKITSFPVQPLEIAKKYNILCEAMPSKQEGVSGMLISNNGNYGILYSTYFENTGFERFSIAHELGHFFLPGHPEAIFSKGIIHFSEAGYRSEDKIELEADQFASGLLMPNYLFDPALDHTGTGLDAIKSLKELCGTSLTATAIRYAQRVAVPAAIVVSTGEKVDYCFMSDELKQYPNLTWLKKGMLLPSKTKTFAFNREANNVLSSKQTEADSDLGLWFQSDIEADIHEQIIGLGSYGKTLTVLNLLNLPALEELIEDEELEESWTPRFRR